MAFRPLRPQTHTRRSLRSFAKYCLRSTMMYDYNCELEMRILDAGSPLFLGGFFFVFWPVNWAERGENYRKLCLRPHIGG